MVKGEHTERGVDGTIVLDVWITDKGDYPKIDVELGTCHSYITRSISMRPASERGQHPGETDHGEPSPPPK